MMGLLTMLYTHVQVCHTCKSTVPAYYDLPCCLFCPVVRSQPFCDFLQKWKGRFGTEPICCSTCNGRVSGRQTQLYAEREHN